MNDRRANASFRSSGDSSSERREPLEADVDSQRHYRSGSDSTSTPQALVDRVRFQEPGAQGPCVVCGDLTAENAQEDRTGLFYPAHWSCQAEAKAVCL